jgi:hypothetical protein
LYNVNNSKNRSNIAALLLLLIALAVVASPLLYSKIAYGAGTFPPGISYSLRPMQLQFHLVHLVSPTSTLRLSIPLGMTVIWFNDSPGLSSVTKGIKQHILCTAGNQSYPSSKRWILYTHIF